jgi:hypothetical protein
LAHSRVLQVSMSLWLKSGGWWRIHEIEIPGYVIEKRKRRLRKKLARKRQRFKTLERKTVQEAAQI